MRVLLASNASHVPPRGGSTRSNLVWLRHLAASGHESRVVAGAESDTPRPEVIQGGICFYSIAEAAQRSEMLRRQIESWQPDWILVSSEDLGHALLREAFRTAPNRVVYLAHTPQFFPFGPESWNRDPEAARLLGGAATIVAISSSVAHYITTHLGHTPVIIHPPVYGAGPWPNFGLHGAGAVTMINPCTVKGLPVFLALAERFPHIAFHALRGWGTTVSDEEAISQHRNIRLIGTVPDIEEELARTHILLMPSLWFEGFGLIVTEAMLRGIPVISSNAGGLVEAKLGTDFVVPARLIETYEPRFDDRNMPVPVTPPQDLDAWERALAALIGDQALYDRESRSAREAAMRFVTGLDAADFERMLLNLKPAEAPSAAPKKLDTLSPEKRALLLRRIRQRP